MSTADVDETPLAWQTEALCAQIGTEMFFPDKGESNASAKKICAECPVADQCLAYAIANGEHFGIWGGKSPRERGRIANDERERRSAGVNGFSGVNRERREQQVRDGVARGLSDRQIAAEYCMADRTVARIRKALDLASPYAPGAGRRDTA